MESVKKLKPFSEFTNTGCLNELLQTAGKIIVNCLKDNQFYQTQTEARTLLAHAFG